MVHRMFPPGPTPRHQWHREFKENGVVRGEFIERRDRKDQLRERLLFLQKPSGWIILAAPSSVTFSSPKRDVHIKVCLELKIFVEKKIGKLEWKSSKESFANVEGLIYKLNSLLANYGK